MRLVKLVPCAALLVVASCYAPHPPEGIPCSTDKKACPDPLVCSFGVCVAEVPPCTPIDAGPGKLTIPRLREPIVVDGDLADWPTCFITITPSTAGLVRDLGAHGQFTPGRFSIAADATRLYVAAEVQSVLPLGDAPLPNIYENNAISVYFDGDGTFTTASYDADAAQVVVDHANRKQGFHSGQRLALPDVVTAATTGPTTFTIEMALAPSSLKLTAFGRHLGFDIGLVGGDGSMMTSELVWTQACAPPVCGCSNNDAAPYCDAREFEVLVPRPSYPLFEHLTTLDAVRAVPYALEYHGVWSLDVDRLRDAITPRTRAILVVSPNNPTGSMLKAHELEAIARLCSSHDLALIGDEVFADYLFEEADPARVSVLAQDQVLTFALGGLSKSAGLPQLKLGWMVMKGPAARCAEAAERLDVICDTYLSVATPVQRAAAMLLEQGAIVRHRIQARIDGNRRALRRALTHAPGCSLLHLEAGWSAVVRVPAIQGEEALVLDLLAQDRVLVTPGYFYDFPREAYLVVSLLPDPDVFAAGIDRLLARAQAALSSL